MSRGTLGLPGSQEVILSNSYGISINLTWLALAAIIVSLITVLFGGLWISDPISKTTDIFTGKLIYFWVLIYRMIVWQVIIVLLDKFFPVFTLCLFVANLAIIFTMQRKIQVEPINYSLLTIIFPVYKLPSLALNKSSEARYLLRTILSGNIGNLVAYIVMYILYDTNFYVPWCSVLQRSQVFPEFLYQFSLWPIITLFCSSSVPSLILLLMPLKR